MWHNIDTRLSKVTLGFVSLKKLCFQLDSSCINSVLTKYKCLNAEIKKGWLLNVKIRIFPIYCIFITWCTKFSKWFLFLPYTGMILLGLSTSVYLFIIHDVMYCLWVIEAALSHIWYWTIKMDEILHLFSFHKHWL